MPHFGPRGVHWLAPTTIILALVVGCLLVLGHHLFYLSLDGEPVSTRSYHIAGRRMSKQQFKTSVGIAFALLVRTSLSIAVSTAYVQYFWRSIRNARPSPKLAELDWASSGVNNVLRAFNVKYWCKYSALVALAMIFWCLPIATIFPPATLSVTIAQKVPSSMLPVPKFEFGSFKYAAGLADQRTYWQWSGPSQAIQYMVSRVMTGGEVLPVTPPAPNATWTLDFWGPALQCDDVPANKSEQIFTNISNSYNFDGPGDSSTYGFLSWVPWSGVDYGENANFSGDATNLAPYLPFLFDFISIWSSLSAGGPYVVPRKGPPSSSISTSGPLSLFVAVLPGTQNVMVTKFYPGQNAAGDNTLQDRTLYSLPGKAQNSGRCDYSTIRHVTDASVNCTNAPENIVAVAFERTTLLQCNLVNRSYSLDFEYSNGQQAIRLRPNTTLNSPVVNGAARFIGPSGQSPESTNCSLLQIVDQPNAYVDEEYVQTGHKDCVVDLGAIRLLSYQGIMAAFNQMILGSYSKDNAGNPETNTTIMRTILADTEELAFLRDWFSPNDTPVDTDGKYNLQTVVANSTAKVFQGLIGEKKLGARGTLKSTLEELFQNYTISLLAEPYFQPNYLSAFAPPPLANVSLPTYQTVYSYDQVTLWVAYGLSILFSVLAAIAGIVTTILSGASYSTQISTIVRVAKTGDLDVDRVVDRKSDGFGRNPLPDYLKHARLNLRADKGNNVDHDDPQEDDGKEDTSVMEEVVEAQSTERERLVAEAGDR